MDIVLDTKTDDPSLSFAGVREVRLRPGNDVRTFECALLARSGWIAVSFGHFLFELTSAAAFLDSLQALYRTLAGEFVIKPLYEKMRVRLTGNGAGRIDVHVDITDFREFPDKVSFTFETDQTCLPRLIADFETLLAARLPGA